MESLCYDNRHDLIMLSIENLNCFGFQNKNRFWAVLWVKKISVWGKTACKEKDFEEANEPKYVCKKCGAKVRKENKLVNPGKFSGSRV